MLRAQPDGVLRVFDGARHVAELQRDGGAIGVVRSLREPPSALTRTGKPGKAALDLEGRQPDSLREGVVGVTVVVSRQV